MCKLCLSLLPPGLQALHLPMSSQTKVYTSLTPAIPFEEAERYDPGRLFSSA